MPTTPPSLGFRPLRLARSGWAQTIAASYWPQRPDRRPQAMHVVPVSGGDAVVVAENRSPRWRRGERIVLMVHGLSGDYRSPYMVRISRKLVDAGLCVMRMNLRGCGPGFGLARGAGHAGRSEDARAVMDWLHAEHPDSPVTLMGFSMGANISLKMAGEDAAAPSGGLDSLIAVSPPVDLEICAENLGAPHNRLFDQHFVGRLKTMVRRHHRRFPDLPAPPRWPEGLTLYQFDDIYTGPRSGFHDAADYYRRSSSLPLLEAIAVPTLVLNAKDDPITGEQPMAPLLALANFELRLTGAGGHVAFLGRGESGRGLRFMDAQILDWMRRRGLLSPSGAIAR